MEGRKASVNKSSSCVSQSLNLWALLSTRLFRQVTTCFPPTPQVCPHVNSHDLESACTCLSALASAASVSFLAGYRAGCSSVEANTQQRQRNTEHRTLLCYRGCSVRGKVLTMGLQSQEIKGGMLKPLRPQSLDKEK